VLWVLIGCAVLAAAGCTAAPSTAGSHPVSSRHPVSPPSPGTGNPTSANSPTAAPIPTQPTALPSGSDAAKVNCPVTPLAGPRHKLTFPASIDGYQYNQGPNSAFETPSYGQSTCNVFSTSAVYINDQQTDAPSIETGYHANLWPTFSSFWGAYLGQFGTPVPVPAGPLGGQAACTLISSALGWTCTWLDSDTFGVFVAAGTASSASQAGSEMLVFRSAVELPA
jgi:hypothetical protein